MTRTLPLVLLRTPAGGGQCFVIVSDRDRPPARSIRPEEIVGQFLVREGQVDQSISSFSRGREFSDFLHASIARNGPSLPGIQAAAAGRHDAYVYVIDGRTPTPQGEVPNEDIIGAFWIQHGSVSSAGYRRYEEHRLYTERGFFQLDPLLVQLVLADLEAVIGLQNRNP
jgi:hypothetical protein